jgi:hypothetical protein
MLCCKQKNTQESASLTQSPFCNPKLQVKKKMFQIAVGRCHLSIELVIVGTKLDHWTWFLNVFFFYYIHRKWMNDMVFLGGHLV